jgi:hypothetical protein
MTHLRVVLGRTRNQGHRPAEAESQNASHHLHYLYTPRTTTSNIIHLLK